MALACLKFHGSDKGMDIYAAVIVAVEHRRAGVAVRFEARPGDALEVIERLVDLIVGRAVLGPPGEDCAPVAVLEVEGVGALGDPGVYRRAVP